MDFLKVRSRSTKRGKTEIFPDFIVGKSKDLMIRGGDFYAIYDSDTKMWSSDAYDLPLKIDNELYEYAEKYGNTEDYIDILTCSSYNSKTFQCLKSYIKNLADNYKPLDDKLIFQNTEVKKSDYASKRLPYALEEGSIDSWDTLISTLYDQEERDKIEWAIGSIIEGDSKSIQKFLVFFGDAGSGKSTILNVVQDLFDGYYMVFDAKKLGSSDNSFALEQFKGNPLVAIQHDGDLSKIEDNAMLNSLVSHEEMVINEKHKSMYSMRINSFLLMATNRPVKITDAKSGLLRRLIDVHPSGRKLQWKQYNKVVDEIKTELGAIAYHCREVYRELGKHYYDQYRPLDMMVRTDVFYNFIEDNQLELKDGISLKRAYTLYKEYCNETGLSIVMPRYKFRDELRNYFENYYTEKRIDGEKIYSYFDGFKELVSEMKPSAAKIVLEKTESVFVFDDTKSEFDILAADYDAQYATDGGTPVNKWADVTTTLKNIDTTKLHYVKVPSNHIVIDFDIKDKSGTKSYEKNLAAANKWPLTYAELSKSGAGIHLHYIYDGDPEELSSVFDDDVEIKVYKGNASLRRKLSRCNHSSITHLSDGYLPKKEKKKVINSDSVKNEKHLRRLIIGNLNKEYHPATKPSVDFMNTLLNDAYNSGVHYDISDMRPAIMAFGMQSSHNAEYCMKVIMNMKFKSEEASVDEKSSNEIVFYDVEVFPNLFVVVYKPLGGKCTKLINPTPEEITGLCKYNLVGFNCRRYDNHIMYARMLGYSNEQLYKLSARIVSGDSKNCFFSEAYNLSYTDIYDYAAKKQSLKLWESELHIHHEECHLPWDQPAPESEWENIANYCINDVEATEAVWNATADDFTVRKILSDISGLSVNDTTNSHTTKIIFGNEKNPQSEFVYTDLSEMFPGYTFDNGKSMYRGEETGEGGYVYAEPGIHRNVALLDIASMHPTSIENLNLFGPYTPIFSSLKQARIYIKHKEFDKAAILFDGKLAPYLKDPSTAKQLSKALKIVINAVYGLTSAKFDNKFRDPRNKDNIVAKRGALFMIDLKHAVQEKGFTVAHIKTDSIKIPDATPEIIEFVMEFGKKYGYTFEHEATYEKMCLVNNAVYIAKYADNSPEHPGEWTATGAEFQHPFIFKTLFSHEPITFDDKCEVKSVKAGEIFLDHNEDDPENHNYEFIGRCSSFIPIAPGHGGAKLVRQKDGKDFAVTGTKDYRWLEAERIRGTEKEQSIDITYYRALVDAAKEHIAEYGDVYEFING